MTEEEKLERVEPWAMALHDMRKVLDEETPLAFGELLTQCCTHRGVPYPPPDIEQALLTHVFRRAAAGAPAPKGLV